MKPMPSVVAPASIAEAVLRSVSSAAARPIAPREAAGGARE